MSNDIKMLDERPVNPKRKQTKVTKADADAEGVGLKGKAAKRADNHSPAPEIILAADPKKEKPITFFSRYRDDTITMTPSELVQVGPGKFITKPAKYLQFRNRTLMTNQPEIIEFLRAHARYGYEILEFGVETHTKRIELYDDGGQITKLERLGRLGRLAHRQWRINTGAGREDPAAVVA